MKYATSRLALVKPSAAVAVSQKAKALRVQGLEVIDLGLGEPDFDTPAHIVDAAHIAAQAGETRYPPTEGTVALREAVSQKLQRDNDLDYALNEIIVCNGAKQVIFDALMATLELGDEVLLCAPYFGQYKDIVLLLGGVPIELKCAASDAFCLTSSVLAAALNSRSRWLILNLPSNPAGTVYTKQQLRKLGKLISGHPSLMVMSDEIYEHIVFDNIVFHSFASACPELRNQILTVNGVSKAYAMTGWRIGYGAGPAPLIKAMTTVQSQVSSGACSVAQAAAVAALNGSQHCVTEFRQAFERRRNLVVSEVEKISMLSLDPPSGAFYAFIGCEAYIGALTPTGAVIESDVDFTDYLLEYGRVAAVPGSAYGLSPFFRISTATSDTLLLQAFTQISECLERLDLN